MASNQEGRQINTVSKSPKIPHSHFTLNKRFGLTTTFAKNVPIYAREFVTDDGPVTIEPNCDIRSYTLKAPMIGTIKKHVSFYQVPLQSVLPFNWEKIVKIPNRGTDVSGDSSIPGNVQCLDGVNTVVSNFPRRCYNIVRQDFSDIQDTFANYPISPGDSQTNVFILSSLIFVLRNEMFLSEGSLIAHLGAHFGYPVYFRINSDSSFFVDKNFSFDEFCEYLLTVVSRYTFSVSTSSDIIKSGSGFKHVRKVLDFMRSHSGPFNVRVSAVGDVSVFAPLDDFNFGLSYETLSSEPYNYLRCVAYQLVNAHYFTNDKVDYINTAELYRQHICSLIRDCGESDSYFSYNGVNTLYDYLSGHYMSILLSDFYEFTPSDVSSDNSFWSYYSYFQSIFGFNYSLRYMDYFVGARPKNLAVGNTSVRVADNTVQVVDITKNLVKQRLLNAVGRIGNTIEEYSDKILGKHLEYDYHNPKYLFSFDADVFTSEVENTGDAQMNDPNSVTAVMRGRFGNHQFTFSIDRYSVIIGIEYTDFARFYHSTQERSTMAIDRFDMFVPELQYIGDQELRRSEILVGSPMEEPFGYQLRDMQFKQAYDECAGGFVDYLPGWLFKFNPLDFTSVNDPADSLYISPSFVRSLPTELDDFYLSLEHMNLAGYFHFIEMWDIKVSAKRPMAYAPEIL